MRVYFVYLALFLFVDRCISRLRPDPEEATYPILTHFSGGASLTFPDLVTKGTGPGRKTGMVVLTLYSTMYAVDEAGPIKIN